MNSFDYVRPATVREAIAAAAVPGAAYLAAGTNLLDLMKGDVISPKRLVDVSRFRVRPDRDLPDGGVRIGALVHNADLAHDQNIGDAFRRSPKRCSQVRPLSSQCRDSRRQLIQRTRCAYFYDTASACNKRHRAQAVMQGEATTGCMPCWAGARAASRPIRPISAFHSLRWTPLSKSRASRADARSRWKHSIAAR